MEEIIEIHDSTLSKITYENKDLTLHFNPAYIIKSKGTILADGGSGFNQNLTIALKDCIVEVSSIEPATDLWTGFSIIDGIKHDNYIPMPLIVEKEFKISITGMTGGEFVAYANSAYIIEMGNPEFIEDIPKA